MCRYKRIFARPKIRRSGEVSATQLAREVDIAYRAWCERRGFNAPAPDPVFNRTTVVPRPVSRTHLGGRRPGDVSFPKLHEIANAIVAMGKPPRGTMRTLADRHGLNYSSLASLVSVKRRLEQAKGRAA